MTDDNPTLSQVPEGVNGYVVEAAASRIQLVMDALEQHCRDQCENPRFVKEAIKARRGPGATEERRNRHLVTQSR